MIDVLLGSWDAGETKTFHVNGSYFEILECAYPIDVKLLDRNGAVRSDMRQAEASFYSEGLEFATIQITSALEQNIRSFYGDGTAGTRRTAGIVEVVDGARKKTDAGMAFLACPYQSQVAGQFARCQIFNPASSGKKIIVNQLVMTSNVQVGIALFSYDTLLANDVTATRMGSKKLGGALGVAKVRTESSAVAYSGIILANFGANPNVNTPFSLEGAPIVLDEGRGMAIEAQFANTNLVMNVEFVEEDI